MLLVSYAFHIHYIRVFTSNSLCIESNIFFICCRIAQKQCCASYLKENSCIAGMIAAREGDLCGSDESDTCGGSFYKARYSAESMWHPC